MFFQPGAVGVQGTFTVARADVVTILGPSINPDSLVASKGFSCFSSSVNGAAIGITGLGSFIDVVNCASPALPYVAITGWAKAELGSNQPGIWGGWFRASDYNTANLSATIGGEVDVVLSATRSHVANQSLGFGAAGFVINNQSASLGAFHGTIALLIARTISGGTYSQWYTGIGCQADTVVAGDSNEFMLVNGASAAVNAHCGIRFAGNLTTGIDMSGATFANGFFPFMPPSKVSGFGTPTGASVIANFSGAGATLAQTSATVAQILTVLQALGFIGS